MRRFGLIAALLTVSVVAAAEIGGGLFGSGGIPSTLVGSKTLSGDLSVNGDAGVAGNLGVYGGTTTLGLASATNIITPATPDSVTSSSVAALTIKLGADIAAGDLALSLTDSSDAVAFKLTEAGVATFTGATTVGGQLSVLSSGTGQNTVASANAGTLRIAGNRADGAGNIQVSISASDNLVTAGSLIAAFFPNNTGGSATANVDKNGFFLQPEQAVTVADDGAGSAPASTITPSSGIIKLAYNDATNSSVGTISETGAQAGSVIRVAHTGTGGTVVFTEVGGQQEIGGTACTLGLSDTFSAVYINSSWHFLSCRDN